MSYSYYGNISTLEKDKLADGSELKRLNDEYRRKNQEHYSSPDNIVLTAKRRHDDMNNDVQEIENDNFQLVDRKNRKRTHALLSSTERNSEKALYHLRVIKVGISLKKRIMQDVVW